MEESGVFVATEVFADLLDGAKVLSVDPGACIPFIHVRDVVRSGVERIKYSYCENDHDDIANGAVCGTSMPTVVTLSGTYSCHVEEYFISEHGLKKEDAKARAQSREVWYGIVDGLHRLMALLELQREKPRRWAGFNWTVLLLQGVQPVQSLRAFARSQNMRQGSNRFVETTLYDLLHGLQEEAKRICAESGGRDPNCKQLAERYSACSERTSTSMRNLATVALKLSQKVVSVIGQIMNFECPQLACQYYAGRGRCNYTESTVSNEADCRIYRNFLTITSLRQASAFLNAKGDDVEDLQTNTLFRLRDICRDAGFKPVSGGTILDQFARANAALKESRKFERLIQSTVWPRGMETLKENLLRSTVMDSDIDANEGNDMDILPPVIQHFRRCAPQRAALLEARYFSTVEKDVSNGMAQGYTYAAPDLTAAQERPQQQLEIGDGMAPLHEANLQTQHEQPTPQKEVDGHELLQNYGITCFQMSWQQYNRTLHSSTDALFDLILTEPPRGFTACKSKFRKGVDECLDNREMQDFARFAQRVLVPGGYLLLFTPAMYFKEWIMLLRANDFSCMDYPFVVAKSSKGVQRENRAQFPQNICEFMIMAVSRGKNSKGFQPDFNEAYKLVSCAYKRKFAAVDHVPVVRTKLTYDGCRSVVCTSEKNPALLAELMVTFSPANAKILDPYAGTMSAGAASLETGRHCTLIEKDGECFEEAFKRLVGLCKSQKIPRNEAFSRRFQPEGETANVAVPFLFDGTEESELDEVGKVKMAGGALQNDSEGEEEEHGNHLEGREEVISSSGGIGSIPSPPSSPIERPTQSSQRTEGQARLTIEGSVVATADIAVDHEEGFRRSLHGQALDRFEKNGEDLVVVWNIRVNEGCRELSYPYNYGGIEGPVQYLSEMEGGFHAWDLNAITLGTE